MAVPTSDLNLAIQAYLSARDAIQNVNYTAAQWAEVQRLYDEMLFQLRLSGDQIDQNESDLTGPAGGDLTGTYPNPTILKIQGVPVDADIPVLNDVLTYNGTKWIPSPATGGSGDENVDGGTWDSIYLSSQSIDGGTF